MSDSELQEQFMLLDNLVVEHQEINDELQSLDDLLQELQGEQEAAPVKTLEPRRNVSGVFRSNSLPDYTPQHPPPTLITPPPVSHHRSLLKLH
ncbi:hypothetical protein Q7C36_014629 [Tachysurus vachellii]|uniref:Uncharacterized protein n=1 Tax=Tachysurus vachellii TaxID=175792 RepID=A0AA88SML6_TACVA|nr:hypothetical protein Q7C36_014629 [Tachysurus vachellii]